MDVERITDKLYADVMEVIHSKKVQVDDAMTLVAYGVKLINKVKNVDGIEKVEILMTVFERIAKGKDGEFGTADDVIPEKVWTQMQTLMQAGIMNSAISVVDSLVNGKFPEVAKTATGCLPVLSKFCIKK